jgi:hypothetical protein
MKRLLLVLAALALLAASTTLAFAAGKSAVPNAPSRAAAVATAVDDDPDMPAAIANGLDKAAYMEARERFLQQRFGDSFEAAYQGRLDAIAQMQEQVRQQGPFISQSYWTAIGPFPIPNGQTTTTATTVSGRVTAIAVHPANANIVYVGLAQGGVWRSLDGGATWTPIFDSATSLAIGALALAPSNPSILYVGTGEANLSADCYFGVGLYRIDDADTAPVMNGPFNPTPATDVIGAKTFTGRSISQILVDPADAATIFVSTGSGIGGLGGEAFGSTPPITSLRGIYRSTDATSASPGFTKLTVLNQGSIAPDVTGNRIINDMVYDPTDPTYNTIVCWVYGTVTAGDGGVWRTTNAKSVSPTFAQTYVTTIASARGTFAVSTAGGVTTMIMGTGENATGTSCTTNSGCLKRSTDGGQTWSASLAGGGGYCGGQCFYDLPVAVSPTDANIILIGGAGNSTCSRVYARSTNGGATFTGAGGGDVGLHADAHAIVFAPSDPNIVYEGNDGGIYKSFDAGATWTSLNNGLSATQFQSIDVHPIDMNFSIGGTQDNGTNWYKPNGTWTRADWGDGGFAVIDQNAADNTVVRMYHTYYNQRSSQVGYARVTSTTNASDGLWGFLGNGANGIARTEYCNFYAPLVRGPGAPYNTIYYATDRLHRSADGGATNPTVSQAPINGTGVSISAVAIAPTNDNVRLIATNNYNLSTGVAVNIRLMGTVSGSSTLVDYTGAGMPVAKYVGRIAIDPTNANNAYVCFGGFGVAAGQHVWKTSNLLTGVPTWAASGSGLPDVPVNAFEIDPSNSQRLFAGTDVGVYISQDGGANWTPYTTGMPVVAVFDMRIQAVNRILRVATHGRGIYERQLDTPVATQLALVGAEIVDGHPRMTWYSADGAGQRMNLYRRQVPGDWALVGPIDADGTGQLTYTDLAAAAGHSYEYRIGVMVGSQEEFMGQVWVDVPAHSAFALRRSGADGHGPLHFTVSLPSAAPARLELVDVTGRRMAALDLANLAAGDHDVTLDASAAPGMYFARLSQAGRFATTRVLIIR